MSYTLMNFVCVSSFNFSGSKCIQLFCDFKEIVLSNEEKYGCCRCFQVNFKEMAFFFQYLCNQRHQANFKITMAAKAIRSLKFTFFCIPPTENKKLVVRSQK